MGTKHTPGPWTVETRTKRATKAGPAIHIAEIRARLDGVGVTVARLIAGAPELPEVLKALVEMADEKVTSRRTHEIANMARAAIAKAERANRVRAGS
jgi:hypothetical protein